MKTILIIIALSLVYPFTDAWCADSVSLTLHADKHEISVGDELQLYFTLKNSSNQQFLFSRLNNSLHGPLITTDEKGNPLRWLHDVIFELIYFPEKSDLFLLKPGEEKTFVFTFVLEKSEKNFPGQMNDNEKYKGYFLSYPKWKTNVYLANKTKVFFQGRYAASDGDRAAAKQYGFRELYESVLKSNLLEIRIKE